MKVRDLLTMEIDVDVYDNVCEEIGIAFCGLIKMKKKGKERFADVLDYDVDYNEHYNVAIVDIDTDDWKSRLKKAKELFYALAGYCADEDWDKWFVEV